MGYYFEASTDTALKHGMKGICKRPRILAVKTFSHFQDIFWCSIYFLVGGRLLHQLLQDYYVITNGIDFFFAFCEHF